MMFVRRSLTRSVVCTDSGEVVGTTRIVAIFAPGATGAKSTAATFGCCLISAASFGISAASLGEPSCATMSSGPLKPGPKPSASRS
jgi:hypothetical protein